MNSSCFPLPLSLQLSFLFPLRKLFLCLLQCSSLHELLILKALFFSIVLSIISSLLYFQYPYSVCPSFYYYAHIPSIIKKNKNLLCVSSFFCGHHQLFSSSLPCLTKFVFPVLSSSSSIFSTHCGLALLLHHGYVRALSVITPGLMSISSLSVMGRKIPMCPCLTSCSGHCCYHEDSPVRTEPPVPQLPAVLPERVTPEFFPSDCSQQKGAALFTAFLLFRGSQHLLTC